MTKQVRLGAIFWLLTVEFFIVQAIAQSAWPAYSMLTDDISNLGYTACGAAALDGGPPRCSPLHMLFNAGMVLNGVLIVLGVWFTRKLWPASPVTTTALWLLAVGGGDGTILVGLFPLNVHLPMHTVGAILALFVACFGLLLLGGVMWRSRPGFAYYTLATGALGLVAFILYGLEIYLGLGRGVMERLAAWPHTVWYMVTGGLILAGHFKPSAS